MDELNGLYAAGDAQMWAPSGKIRLDWQVAADWIRELAVRNVLDVGCFDGSFLATLPPELDRAGVEIHAGAAKRAVEAGVRMIGSDLHDLTTDEQFDCVVAFDVIEHVQNPLHFLGALASLVRPGGYLVIATGNLEAPTWRVMGSGYLYCWFREHIAFVSPTWMRLHAGSVGLQVRAVEKYSPRPGRRSALALGAAKNVVHRVAPRLIGAFRSNGGPPPAPPAWGAARDHFAVLLQRPTSDTELPG